MAGSGRDSSWQRLGSAPLAHSLRPSSAGLEEPPRSEEAGPGGPHFSPRPQARSRPGSAEAIALPQLLLARPDRSQYSPRCRRLTAHRRRRAMAEPIDGRAKPGPRRRDERRAVDCGPEASAPPGGEEAGALLLFRSFTNHQYPLNVPPSARLLEPRLEQVTVFLQRVLIIGPGSDYQSVERELTWSRNFGLASGEITKYLCRPGIARVFYVHYVQRGDSPRLSEPDYYDMENTHHL